MFEFVFVVEGNRDRSLSFVVGHADLRVEHLREAFAHRHIFFGQRLLLVARFLRPLGTVPRR